MPQQVNLAFVIADRAGDEISKMIAKASGYPESHVECWLSGPIENATCFSSRADGGAKFKQIDLRDPKYDIVPVEWDYDIAHAVAVGMEGKGYDFGAIILFNAPTEMHADGDVFCSEALSVIGVESGKLVLRVPAWKTSPGELRALVTAQKAAA